MAEIIALAGLWLAILALDGLRSICTASRVLQAGLRASAFFGPERSQRWGRGGPGRRGTSCRRWGDGGRLRSRTPLHGRSVCRGRLGGGRLRRVGLGWLELGVGATMRWVLFLAVILPCAVAEASSDKSRAGETCSKTSDCTGKLRCIEAVCRDAELWACRHSKACKVLGMCTPEKGACIAKFADCSDSDVCRISGQCEADKGSCVATDDAFCRVSESCVHGVGYCTFKDGRCAAVRTEDCALECKYRGLCTVSSGSCVAATPQDCARSVHCRLSGECRQKDNRCVGGPPNPSVGVAVTAPIAPTPRPTTPECEQGCILFGLCAPSESTCIAETDLDCASSQACLLHKRCSAVGGRCVLQPVVLAPVTPVSPPVTTTRNDPFCQDSCGREGMCDSLGGKCLAGSSEGCARSKVCKLAGRCRAVDGKCVK